MLVIGLLFVANTWAAAPRAYITNSDGTISVVDTGSNSVVATIPVGEFGQVAINPAGTYVYVTDYSNNQVLVIDTRQKTVVATVPVGHGPGGIAIGGPPSDFFDVISNSYYIYIEALFKAGITQGCGYGDFCPSENVTRHQMAAFLYYCAKLIGFRRRELLPILRAD